MKKTPFYVLIIIFVLAVTVLWLAGLANAKSNTTVIFNDGDFVSGWIDISGVTDDPFVPGQGPVPHHFMVALCIPMEAIQIPLEKQHIPLHMEIEFIQAH